MKTAKDYIIFPLDLPSQQSAKEYIRLLSGEVGMFKIGLELFIEAGPDIVKYTKSAGPSGIFLDLKLHDIPATVSRAMSRVAEMGVRFATVHCGENREMLKSAVEGSRGKTGVLGVTVLTSVSAEDIRTAGFREEYASHLSSLVLQRAAAVKECGCAGIVCSGLEAGKVKEKFGKDFIVITPGIRPAWAISGQQNTQNTQNTDDQKRVVTPLQAIRSGADYLVIGRPIRDAENPKSAARRVVAEITAGLPESAGGH